MDQHFLNGKLGMVARHNRGFSYMGLLLFIAIAGIGLSAVGMTWHSQVKAENEQQLLFVGTQFRNALNSYYESTPVATKTYPLTLQDLLRDKRFPNVKRHLRQIYTDPMTGNTEWGINRAQGRIVGIYSLSTQKPFKLSGFTNENQSFNYAKSYREWIFGQVGSTLAETGISANGNKANEDKTGTPQLTLKAAKSSSSLQKGSANNSGIQSR
ncbi:MAG: type II secretion system protein [Candidatus Methylopumilus sp.]|jgi:type II secretory pathway pseudopilin PulG